MKIQNTLLLVKKLQKYLISNKLTINRMAERLEVSVKVLNDLIHGIYPTDVVLLKRLANLLNLRLSDIFFEHENIFFLKEKSFYINFDRSSKKLDLIPSFE